jgi:hypothetical protein
VRPAQVHRLPVVEERPAHARTTTTAGIRRPLAPSIVARRSQSFLQDSTLVSAARAIGDLRSVSQALSALASEHPNAVLLVHTGLEPPALALELQRCAQDADASFEACLEPHSKMSGDARFDERSVRSIMSAWSGRLLRGRSGTALTNMLRLWQVLETYCKLTDHPEGMALREDGRRYRESCVIFLDDARSLGIAFHPAEFLQPPTTRLQPGQFLLSSWPPMLQNNGQLTAPWVRRLDEADGLVADVSQWGVECARDPELSTKTTLSCWWR